MYRYLILLALPVLIGAASFRPSNKYSNLIGYWPLITVYSQSPTVATDRSSTNNHATLTGTPPVLTAADGVDLNGSGDYVNIPDLDIYSFASGGADKPFSMCIWLYLQATVSQPFITKRQANSPGQQSWYFGTVSLSRIYFAHYDDDDTNGQINFLATSGLEAYANAWHFYCATYDGTDETGINVYIDGVVPPGTRSESGTYTGKPNDPGAVTVGKSLMAYGNFKAQEYMIWCEEKTQTEILSIYNTSRDGADLKIDPGGSAIKVAP